LRAVRQERAFVAARALTANGLSLEGDFCEGSVLDIRQERGIWDGRDARVARPEALEHRQQHDRDDYPQNDVLRQIVQSVTSQDGERRYSSPLIRPYYIL